MAAEFSKAVALGLKLSKRIYYGREHTPPSTESMTPEVESFLPTAVMVYAEVNDPIIVDNPDVASYQPYVHGRCDPPALIPLQMHGVVMEVDCQLDMAFVTVSGAWRVHCVTTNRSCYCRVAVPIGEQGSILGVEVQSSSNSYCTELIASNTIEDAEELAACRDGILIKGQIYTLKIPKVYGGTNLAVKVRWSQKLLYQDGHFHLDVPFTFPSYVFPVMKKFADKEKIVVNVNSGTGAEALYQSDSHPLKRITEDQGKVRFSYEREGSAWSVNDFRFSYNVRPNNRALPVLYILSHFHTNGQVSSGDIVGGLLTQSPSLHDYDQRDMFCFYLYPGQMISKKVFKKEVVFLVDISASMQGSPLENVKTALLAALLKLSPVDRFNIIAFNGSSSLFSPSLSLATKEMVEKASEWIRINFVAKGDTNISASLDQAINMVSKGSDLLPIIFLITDGAVENEKDICDAMKDHLMKGGSTSARICTFGIGSYCNHYFLQMLAQIGRGHYDAAFDVDSIKLRMEGFLNCASSVILADITIDALVHLDSVEFYPYKIPDLLSGCPLFISGRYSGKLPDNIEVSGTLSDLSKFVLSAKVQRAKDIPIDRVFARRQIFALTANAWFSGSKLLEEKATKLSLHTGMPSEYTRIVLLEADKIKSTSRSKTIGKKMVSDAKEHNMMFLLSLGLGFGDVQATAENRPPEHAEPKLYGTSDKIFEAAADICGKCLDRICCMCFIQCCSKVNDQCAVVLAQLCAALACFECINVCCDICSCDF